jgi:hypothetical protein
MLLMDRAAFPVLFSVTVWAVLVVLRFWLLKVRLVGVTPAVGALAVPVRLTLCVLPAALLLLSVMVNAAVRVPGAVGVKVTLMVQLLLAASELPQLLV